MNNPKTLKYVWSFFNIMYQWVNLFLSVLPFISHCVKSVQIRSFFWSVFFCIRTEYRKIRIRNNSVFEHFSRSVSFYEVGWTYYHGCMIEIQLFSFRFSIWVNIFLYVNDFQTIKKPKHVSDFVINFWWNCQEPERRKRNKKSWFWVNFFILDN